jgi:hypothetical protein
MRGDADTAGDAERQEVALERARRFRSRVGRLREGGGDDALERGRHVVAERGEGRGAAVLDRVGDDAGRLAGERAPPGSIS